ncbi:MAG TPA: transporter, partial [Pirellulales bacterium]|nr:transporter [Pirellulales bacterium]
TTALSASSVSADEPGLLCRLPPVVKIPPDEIAPDAQQQALSQPAVAGFPDRVAFERADSPTADTRTYQLLSLQEPVAASQSAVKSQIEVAQPARGLFSLTAGQETVPTPEGEPAADAASPSGEKGDKPPTYGRAPESDSLQFLRTQDVLLKPGDWQFDTGFAYTNFDAQTPVGLANGNGDLAGVVQGHIRRRLIYTPLAFRYGWSRNVQLFGFMPVGDSDTQTSTVGTSTSKNSGGIGDLTTGANFHLFESHEDQPDVIATFAMTAPTGAFASPLFGLVPGSALGQGFWAISGQLVAIHNYDPIVVYYGGGYRHLFERHFDGTLFAAGEQINYLMGVGFSVNDRVTLSTTLLGFYITSIHLNGSIDQGTNIEPISLRFAATISRRNHILEPFALIGMTDYAPAASLGITVTYK